MAIRITTRTGYIDFAMRSDGVLFAGVFVPITPAQQERILEIATGALIGGGRATLSVRIAPAADETPEWAVEQSDRAVICGILGIDDAQLDGRIQEFMAAQDGRTNIGG